MATFRTDGLGPEGSYRTLSPVIVLFCPFSGSYIAVRPCPPPWRGNPLP
jgi:hypothetical protein